ncbi:death domain-containing protein CRADD-like isoform X2 [Bacillus rossius redtenbacheri]|uniref:death domain-containing protein CRADD-like isoform X2 n=1 Tax=Bacillus rossius redtenbacheri TaxID=93214 RepID=UPI002FDCF570
MDATHVAKLRAVGHDLRSQLIFEHIATLLLQEELLSREEYQRVSGKVTDPERIDALLELLPSKGPDSFDKFVYVLAQDYRWLADRLRAAQPERLDSGTRPAVPNITSLNKVVTPEMMAAVRENHRVVRSWTTLAHALGMSCKVHGIRTKVLVYGEDLELCVVYLLQEWVGSAAGEATLSSLLDALRREHYNDVADELEAKFA